MLLRMMKVILTNFFILLCLTSIKAHADCYWTNSPVTINQSIRLNSVVVQRDAPVGTVLLTQFVSTGLSASVVFAQCSYASILGTVTNAYWALTAGNKVSGYSNVYATNVAGVGIRIQAGTSPYYYDAPATLHSDSNPSTWAWSSWGMGYTITLIKTGATGSGDIGAKQTTFTLSNLGTILTLNITGGSVTTLACKVTTPNVTVPLDPVFANSFTGSGTTLGNKDFTIGLNCDAGARINASLSFVQNTDTADNSVMALTGAGANGVASGVGIQLLYGNTPLQNNTNIVLKTSTGGQEFPTGAFTARYYQTNNTVTAGDASATATLNLTYQ